MAKGLWAYSRHPNYFGEVLFCVGLFLFALASDSGYWWMIIGRCQLQYCLLSLVFPLWKREVWKEDRNTENLERKSSIYSLVSEDVTRRVL